jgi:hypothetical protein
MNCQAVQNQMLGLPDPRELSPALRAHVRACPACRVWARRAARLEAILERLPAPAAPGEKKEEMLGELMMAEPVIRPMVVPATRPGVGVLAARYLRRNAAYVGGLAAAVLIAVGVSALWPGTPVAPPREAAQVQDPLLRKITAHEAALSRADTPAKRLDALGGLADVIATDTRGLAMLASGPELRRMAGWYEEVVSSALVPQARELQRQLVPAPAEKVQLLDGLAAKLNADAAEAERVAGNAPPDAQPALKRLADAARDGEKALRDAARGGK